MVVLVRIRAVVLPGGQVAPWGVVTELCGVSLRRGGPDVLFCGASRFVVGALAMLRLLRCRAVGDTRRLLLLRCQGVC